MRIASLLVRERVENPKLCRPDLHRVPSSCARFPLRKRLRGLQEFLHFPLFSWFSFQLCPNCEFVHGHPPQTRMQFPSRRSPLQGAYVAFPRSRSSTSLILSPIRFSLCANPCISASARRFTSKSSSLRSRSFVSCRFWLIMITGA